MTVDQAKAQIRLEHAGEDDLVADLVNVAADQVENYLGLSLISQVVTLYLDAWPAEAIIYLPRGPVALVNSVKYYDTDGAQQTIDPANYQTDLAPRVARVAPVQSYSWPSLADRLAPVQLEYQAGFGPEPATVPWTFRQAILLQLGTLYENRESVVVGPNVNELPHLTVQALLGPHRVHWNFGQ